MKMAVTVLGRIGFGLWLAVVGLFAMASLIGHPGPFILMAFVIGGLPVWVIVRDSYVILAGACIGSTVTAVPVLMLVGYGVDEGGISPIAAVPLFFSLGVLASTLAWLGLVLGKLVWSPWR